MIRKTKLQNIISLSYKNYLKIHKNYNLSIPLKIWYTVYNKHKELLLIKLNCYLHNQIYQSINWLIVLTKKEIFYFYSTLNKTKEHQIKKLINLECFWKVNTVKLIQMETIIFKFMIPLMIKLLSILILIKHKHLKWISILGVDFTAIIIHLMIWQFWRLFILNSIQMQKKVIK